MKSLIKPLILSIIAYSTLPAITTHASPAFHAWKQACDKLPYCKKKFPNYSHTMIKSFTHDEFERTLDQFSQMMAKSSMSDHNAWLKDNAVPGHDFFDLNKDYPRDLYVQKYECPQGSTFILHGDLHGDIHSLVTALADYIEPSHGFTLKSEISMIFLGDYVDKGLYGCECIYTLMRLKLANPDRVFLLRGNHETREISSHYGFKTELIQKGFSTRIIDKIFHFYSLLPVALYVGSDDSFVQCCHGGFEVGFNAGPLLNAPQQFQWINKESCNRKKIAAHLGIAHCCQHYVEKDPKNENESGFMWTDFIVDRKQSTFFTPERGLHCSYKTSNDYLTFTNASGPKKLRCLLRAHQHNLTLDPMMRLLLDYDHQDPANKGIAKLWTDSPQKGNHLWDGMVATFNVSPDTPYGIAAVTPGWPGFDFDTIGTLTINGPFEQWTLDIRRKAIPA